MPAPGPQDGRHDEAQRVSLLRRLVATLGDRPDAVAAGQVLLDRYAEPHRRYHDLQHLAEVLAALDTLAAADALPEPVVWAAYWHDAVYEPTAGDNEERSAVLAAHVLTELGVADEHAEETARLVRATAAHAAEPADAAGALLCDADLAILAAPPGRYGEYVNGVRQEYAHLDDAAFRHGRAGVLRALVDRPRLFATEHARQRWEADARANVAAELARLDTGEQA